MHPDPGNVLKGRDQSLSRNASSFLPGEAKHLICHDLKLLSGHLKREPGKVVRQACMSCHTYMLDKPEKLDILEVLS